MTLASISLAAVVLTVAVSCFARINVGLLAVGLAWLIGGYVAPWLGSSEISAQSVVRGFPVELFVTLTGVTLLFSLAQVNGTLPRVTQWALRGCRGNAGLMPPMFFVLTLVVATVGAGNIAAAALIAPAAMTVALRSGIPPLLMLVMVGHGAIGGGLSPFSPMGVIAGGIMEQANLGGHMWTIYAYNALTNALVALAAYLMLGGWRLLGSASVAASPGSPHGAPEAGPIEWRQLITLAGVGLLIAAVIGIGVHLGLAAFAVTAVLLLAKAGDQQQTFRAVPWNVIVMVCGMTMLVDLTEQAGGVDLCSELVSRVATSGTIVPLMACLTGVVSVFSSTSGVVLPVFLPMSNELASRLGADPLSIATAINIGSGIVDVSPVSTIGALCLAAVGPSEQHRYLFHQVLAWSLAMALVAAALCWLLLG